MGKSNRFHMEADIREFLNKYGCRLLRMRTECIAEFVDNSGRTYTEDIAVVRNTIHSGWWPFAN